MQFVADVSKSCQTLREIAAQRVYKRMDDILARRQVPHDALTILLQNALNEPEKSHQETIAEVLDEFLTLFVAGIRVSTSL